MCSLVILGDPPSSLPLRHAFVRDLAGELQILMLNANDSPETSPPYPQSTSSYHFPEAPHHHHQPSLHLSLFFLLFHPLRLS
ncbi:hypothetical protein E2C01_085172 [Portunus trituberculatus]|uniref:Uncharacterized protein n=1 Tax=Portunus trituberculatus TaxID=210409 RepID=A0A5B7JB72_PORTR|nr:hypothetical protein [Portunus trituberculatus]